MMKFDSDTIPKHNVSEVGIDAALWKTLITGDDQLRLRVAFALSEIFVVNVRLLRVWKNFAAADFMDLLLENAFGNYRVLLEAVSRHYAMACYLTFLNNKKANGQGPVPDENYAREILQLFTIGLYQLNPDGTQKLNNGKSVETYDQDDIMGLARVFTGWVVKEHALQTPECICEPLMQRPAWHEMGDKRFLGYTIPAGTNGEESLKLALDHIFLHPNVGPFICKQLIQRLVTSNPTSRYLRSVVEVFNDNGKGVRGDLKAVVKAILLHPDARDLPAGPVPGKLREPVLRFTAWARAFSASSPDFRWDIPDTDDPALGLGQSPLRSSTVFNFFRPGYVPPHTVFTKPQLVAPEFQITDEVSVAGYLNFMQKAVFNQLSGIQVNYSGWVALAEKPATLVDRLNLVLAAGQLSDETQQTILHALESIDITKRGGRLQRVQAATMLVLACPEFIAIQ